MAGDGHAVHFVSNQPISSPRRERPSLQRAPALGPAAAPGSRRHDRSRSRVAAGIYLVLLTASIAVMILAVLLLTVPSVKDAGIITFEFQWDLTVPHERLQPRSGIVFAPDIPKVVETVTRAAEPTGTTIITDETQSVSQVLSGTVSTAPTATDKLPGRPHFETGLPRRLSLGTRRFCIQHEPDRCECQPLPVHLSRAVPELAPEVLAHVTEPLQHIEDAVVTPVAQTVCQTIATGLAVSVVIAIATMLLSRLAFSHQRWLKCLTMGLLSVICLVLFLTSIGIIFSAQSAARSMEDEGAHMISSVELGSAGKYSLGAVCCAVVLVGCSLSLGGL